jgi:hypothetical protein
VLRVCQLLREAFRSSSFAGGVRSLRGAALLGEALLLKLVGVE